MKRIILLLLLTACAPVAKPSSDQATYQGSPNIVINPQCKENCGGATVTTNTTATAQTQSEQPVEQTSKSQMWIFWTIALVVGCIGGYFIWRKFRKI